MPGRSAINTGSVEANSEPVSVTIIAVLIHDFVPTGFSRLIREVRS